MNKQIQPKTKKIPYYLSIAVAIFMLPVTQLVFKTVADSYVKPCPEFTEFGACKLQYGLSASVMGAAAAAIWVLLALTILVISLYRLKKLAK